MNDQGGEQDGGRIVLLAPTAKDARTASTLLEGAGLSFAVCQDLDTLCCEVRQGAAVAILHEEALLAHHIDRLVSLLEAQPPWSDLPLIILAGRGATSPTARKAVEVLGNVTLLERPVRVPAFLSTVRTALKARERQYQIRDYLAEQLAAEARLRESKELLSFALKAGNLGSWRYVLATGEIECSPLCQVNFGFLSEERQTIASLLDRIHHEDREAVEWQIQHSLESDGDYDVEYRFLWPDGSIHWVLVRGRGFYDDDGRPLGMAGISLDVTAWKEAEAKLRDNDRRKDEFLAMLAHELRNPLSAIGNAAQVLHRSDSREHLIWAKRVVDHQVGHLSRMINDLLDVSRITQGKIQLQKEILEVLPVIHDAVETVRPLIVEKKHILTLSVEPGPFFVEADPTRLEQIIVNLLNNAAKYTQVGGRITLAAGLEDDQFRLSVGDNGMGIPPDKLPMMFELFAQGDRTIARSEGGLGIGLTLVRRLAEMHGGTVTAISEGEGKGSEFVLRLPVASGQVAAHSPTPTKAVEHSGTRILVVDDNVDSARGLARLLKLLGHDVRVVHDGPTAIEAARLSHPQFILLDIGMPGMDGYEVAQRLREGDGCKDAVFIAVTGYAKSQVQGHARGVNFDYHFVKPIDHDALISLLARDL